LRNLSIYTFIHIIFSIAFVSVIALFLFFVNFEHARYKLNEQDRLNIIANSFLTHLDSHLSQQEINSLSRKLNIVNIINPETKLNILNNAKVIYKKESYDSRLRIFELNKRQYLYIQKIGHNLMFIYNKTINYNQFIAIFIFLTMLCVLLVLYSMFIRKLKPLKNLNDKIQQFSKGDLNVNIDLKSNDEIGQIANSFNEAISNINSLINSKNLFMRNIMHELKTPITKGLLLTEIIETPNIDDKQLLIKNYEHMNNIISQLSNIEKMKTQYLNIKKEQLQVETIIDEITQLLHIEEQDIQVNYEHHTIIANHELFLIILKNLIENAYRYSTQKPILLDIQKDKLIVKSKGEKLQNDLSYYTQAFTQEKKNNKGLGLGLYIVNESCILHNFKLEYSYIEGFNCFTLLYNQDVA
jgi:two-component system OmpR family sensor kinase